MVLLIEGRLISANILTINPLCCIARWFLGYLIREQRGAPKSIFFTAFLSTIASFFFSHLHVFESSY